MARDIKQRDMTTRRVTPRTSKNAANGAGHLDMLHHRLCKESMQKSEPGLRFHPEVWVDTFRVLHMCDKTHGEVTKPLNTHTYTHRVWGERTQQCVCVCQCHCGCTCVFSLINVCLRAHTLWKCVSPVFVCVCMCVAEVQGLSNEPTWTWSWPPSPPPSSALTSSEVTGSHHCDPTNCSQALWRTAADSKDTEGGGIRRWGRAPG